jgi:uncharacterized membrane protein YhdT
MMIIIIIIIIIIMMIIIVSDIALEIEDEWEWKIGEPI